MSKAKTDEFGTHEPVTLPSEMDLVLTVKDPEIIAALYAHERYTMSGDPTTK